MKKMLSYAVLQYTWSLAPCVLAVDGRNGGIERLFIWPPTHPFPKQWTFEHFPSTIRTFHQSNHEENEIKGGDVNLYQPELWTGFPPKKLRLPKILIGSSGNASTTFTGPLVKDFIRAGQNVMVKFETINSPSSGKKSISKKRRLSKDTKEDIQTSDEHTIFADCKTKSAHSSNSNGRKNRSSSKRVSAIAATASFTDTIRAQNRMIKMEKWNHQILLY